jgi:hypothetical protein
MTPLEAALIAQAVYSASPDIGVESTAGRASIYGTAIAFPGSDNIACWLADLDVETIFVPSLGRIHSGFFHAWTEIQTGVTALPTVEITIGHSEGAAIAMLAAANLCLLGRPPRQVFAFEPPRITTDTTMAQLFADNGVDLHLYRNGFDVVPIVPRLLEDWQHPAPLTYIGVPLRPFPNVEDHSMQRVIQSLSA